MDVLSLMQQQVGTLYEVDALQRLGRIPDLTQPENDWEAAPRFFMGRTTAGNIWHFRHDLPAEHQEMLDVLCRNEPFSSSPQEPIMAAQIRKILGGGEEYRGPAYLLPQQSETGQALEITPENADLLLPHFPSTAKRASQGNTDPITAVIRDGQAVAVCSTVRRSGLAAEAGVHTLEAWRGHGYAMQVAALWVNLIRQDGLLPFYSTSWDNLASQGVARKLQAQMFGENWSIQ